MKRTRKNRVHQSVDYNSLERRQVLASFSFAAPTLHLDSFDVGEDMDFFEGQAVIDGTLQDAFVFQIDGSWTGDSSDPLIEVESSGGTDNRLEVAFAFFGGDKRLSIDATNDIAVDVFTDLLLDGLYFRSSQDFSPLAITSTDDVTIYANSIGLSQPLSANGSVILNARNGVLGGTDVTADNLMLEGVGVFTMVGTNNDIGRLSTNISGDLTFSQPGDINISDLSSIRPSQRGLAVRGDASLSSGAGSIIQAPDARAYVAQQFTVGALNDIDFRGDGSNNFGEVAVVQANHAEVVDANNLIVNGANGDKVRIQAGAGGNGRMIFDGDVNITEQFLVQAFNGARQRSGNIIVPEMLVGGENLTEARGTYAFVDTDTIVNQIDSVSGNLELGAVFVDVNSDIMAGTPASFLTDFGTAVDFEGLSTSRTVSLTSTAGTVTLDGMVNADMLMRVNAGLDIADSARAQLTGDVFDFDAGNNILIGDEGTNTIMVDRISRFNAGIDITVGEGGGYTSRFLRFETPGSVNIQQTGRMILAENNTAATADLTSDFAILDAFNTTTNISGDASFTADRGISMGNEAGDSIMFCGTTVVDVNNFIQLLEPGSILIEDLDIVPNGANEIIFIDGGC